MTLTVRGAANCLFPIAFCGVPLIAVTFVGSPGRFVNTKVAAVDTPATVAVTLSEPAIPFAVNAPDVATPLAFVVAVVLLVLPPVGLANVPLAPAAGAAKTTIALLTGFRPLSTTVTCSGVAKLVFTAALWLLPAVAVTVAGAPVVLVRSNVAKVGAPAAEAVTA